MAKAATKVPPPPAPSAPTAPAEPVLELDDIQGIAVPGFLKPHQALVYLRFPQDRAGFLATQSAIREMVRSGAISNGAVTLKDRRDHRRYEAGKLKEANRPPLMAIGFTAQGLGKLTPAVTQIDSPAFLGGLPQRSTLLGDPTDPSDPGAPQNWVVGKPGEELDAMVVVAADHRETARDAAGKLASQFAGYGAEVSIQPGDVRADDRGHEHFGFYYGVSQPGIRGRASAAPDDYITDRHLDPADIPDAWLYGYPGQTLVWPGELVLGYPSSGPDPLIAGPVTPCVDWLRNGSFLVYRRLRQDVAGFWTTMRAEAGAVQRSSRASRGSTISSSPRRWSAAGRAARRLRARPRPTIPRSATTRWRTTTSCSTTTRRRARAERNSRPQRRIRRRGRVPPAHISAR